MRAAALDDTSRCLAILRAGSKSFYAASLMLPPRMRAPSAAVYGFCRIADDAVDRAADPGRELERLHTRLERLYRGAPEEHPVDRALARVVRDHRLPREVFEALLEGFAWDVQGRRYETLEELRAYCVRVASTVGVLMTLLMGERREKVLRRACDLGVAMQLTNIARDVGEDARDGRVYLPTSWLAEVGLSADALSADPRWSERVGFLVRRLLAEADPLYRRADLGISQLPRDCRVAIGAARLIYADIDRAIVRNGYDSINTRAFTGRTRKAALLARALSYAVAPSREPVDDPALPEAEALIDAVCGG